jgi:IS5 family transposase
LEDSAKLRVDTTVVQTDIHHPTDNTLLWDVVRVVTRLVRRLAKALELRRIKGFCDRTRSARQWVYKIQRMTTRQRHEQQTHAYRVLIDIAEEVVGNARAGLERTRTMRGKDMFTDMAIEELRGQMEHFCGLGDRVIDQARHRVPFGEQVATDEKIYSIFEPHTDLIKRGKVRTPAEFGHKVFLAESAEGLIESRSANHLEHVGSSGTHQGLFQRSACFVKTRVTDWADGLGGKADEADAHRRCVC